MTDRFAFGANWADFLTVLDDTRVAAAVDSLRTMLEVDDLAGRRFLDIGSGSGLFSLAARTLGATVHSFDYDAQSVACTTELRRRYFTDDPDWTVEQGSVLDEAYMTSLGTFDIVYSWGVLHHTGQMYAALDRAMTAVADDGRLFIAIYNDQGWISDYWAKVKRLYCHVPAARWPLLAAHAPYLIGAPMAVRLLAGRSGRARGMAIWHDLKDWVGGHPFETARPERIIEACRQRQLVLQKLVTVRGRHGCNEFVFRRQAPARLDGRAASPSANR